MAKHLKVIEVYFLKKLKYFDIFKKKILHGFYNKFVNSQRILAYISKILNFLFILIRRIMNLYIRHISNIK